MMEYRVTRNGDYLAHYGVKGQKHGVRQYQNEDGSLTNLGREHYGVGQGRYGGNGGQGYEARRAYKRGEISKEERKQATRAGNIIGKVDNVMNLGFGRRIREFEDRHKKGIMGATVALGIAGTIAVGALSGGAAPAIVSAGSQAVGSIIGTGLRLKALNPLMLKYGYNSKITSEGFKPSYERSKKD